MAPSPHALRRLDVSVASRDALDVRHFHVVERMNELFEISIVALSENPDIDFEAVAGQPMTFALHRAEGGVGARTWTGLCSHIEQLNAEERGLSTYKLVLVPVLWLLAQRRNHRMFQLQSELDIARKLLGEWNVATVEKLSGTYKKRKYVVQYGETDFTFLCRILEDAGVSFYFQTDGDETKLVLHDAPQSNPRRPPIAFRDNPTDVDKEHVTEVRVGRRIRPGKYTVRDHDYRRPAAYDLRSSAKAAGGIEESLERFHYIPGAFLFESDKGDPSPIADDKGRYRTDEKEAAALTQRRLAAKRAPARTITFETNTIDPAPGVVVSLLDHPKSELAPGKGFLVTSCVLSGHPNAKWSCSCEAVSADQPYHPPLVTPKPKAVGVESATVVGPAGEEIHTDEFGRVRVHFHWDRESKMNDASSCWIHSSQPWGGSGFGGTNLPRIGQEVIVDFLGGDPDRPIITGRVYTNLQKTPYKLPDNKTQSGWQSRSSPGGGASNYNEVMFEDKTGQELLRVQAEKDLDKLVKNDESMKIGHDRTRLVGNNESVTVGNSRSKSVAVNESLFVGANQNEQVGANLALTVGLASAETVGVAKALTVGVGYQITVGAIMSTTVGEKFAIVCGKSSIVMEKSGKIAITGTEISVNGTQIVIAASGPTEVHGASVKITGEPIDLN